MRQRQINVTKDIYLDTNLWNALCDQSVDPTALVRRLALKNAYLAPGIHIFYELAKTFRNSDNKSRERGKVLFSYFKEFLLADTHCVKDNLELLAREMWAAKLGSPVFDITLSMEDRNLIFQEAEKFSKGEISRLGSEFLQQQSDFASNTRSNQLKQLTLRADMTRYLKSIPPAQLEQWLHGEGTSKAGIKMLAVHILRRFPDVPEVQTLEYATALLAPSPKRFARGVVRSDLYYNWRCANRGSVPKDLIDDMYHVLNAVYCDVYATAERGQTEYAHMILTPLTKVAVYTGGTPLDDWIESLC